MDKSALIKLFFEMNNEILATEDVEDIFKEKCRYISRSLPDRVNEPLGRIFSYLSLNTFYDCEDVTHEQQYMFLNFSVLELLNAELLKPDNNILSVQEMKNVKTALINLMSEGILKNLQPKLPHCIPRTKVLKTKEEVYYYYNLLKSTVLGFVNCLKNHTNMRPLILPQCLQGILAGVIQIAYGPLKRPEAANVLVSAEMYEIFLEDQTRFRLILDYISQNIHPSMFVKELMLLFHKEAPIWFKKALSLTLTKVLRSKNGIRNVAGAMFDDCEDDTTKTWQRIAVLTKVILSSKKLPNFEANICAQILNLLEISNAPIYERLVVSCVKNLYCEDPDLCTKVFLEKILAPLKWFTDKNHKFEQDDYSLKVQLTVRLMHGLFVEGSECKLLPVKILKSYVNVIFILYHFTIKTSFESCNKQLGEVFLKYLSGCERKTIQQIFDNLLFGFDIPEIDNFRSDIIVEIDGQICVKSSSQNIIHATSEVFNSVYNVLDTNQRIIMYGYLLKCLSEKEKYFLNLEANKSLLECEDFGSDGSTVFKRLLAIIQLLSQLSDNADVQKTLKESPDDVIDYIMTVLSSKADSHIMFTVVMIVDNLISNTAKAAFVKYKILLSLLSNIAKSSTDPELKNLCEEIVLKLNQEEVNTETEEDSEFDKALEDVFDPLLPTRGHGLLVLSKLLEKKDKRAMDRKQYLLNLFQLHLKDEDSFIYLNAVQGLASLADIFTDTILQVLCEEYSEGKKDSETRMKLGEVLVRVVKLLGDMAPKYKALLLNTFLLATKDDDHLVRASNLSNLGEVCKVLGYKLGTIITEVLVCVHSIIATDKAVEARRAAVTVLRQLFVGLQKEMLNFLKEEILPIYHTLKEIYYNDQDDVMRLQAQLALEELNENVKAIVFPNEQLHFEKNIVTLD